jgi:hypothetical protein
MVKFAQIGSSAETGLHFTVNDYSVKLRLKLLQSGRK